MRRPEHNTTALPRTLREELGVSDTPKTRHGKRTVPGLRKEQRKAARSEKKAKTLKQKPNFKGKNDQAPASNVRLKPFERLDERPIRKGQIEQDVKDDYSIPKSRPQQRRREPSSEDSGPDPSPPPRLNNVTRDKLAADDAEIEALEKALGVKGKKKLPQLFEDDGLDGLLDGLGDGLDEDTNDRKRRRDEGDEWLEAKRKKTRKSDRDAKIIGIASSSESDEEEGEFGVDASSAGGEGDDGPSSERSDEDPSATQFPRKTARENPYRAPGTSSAVAAPKYVPPSLRNQASSETEDLSRLRRQIQGLINRLSEANMLSILGDIESLYRTNARQHVSSTLLDILIGLLCDPSPLHDTFVILHAGFIVALYKTIGPDFGAQAVQRFDGEFRLYYEMAPDDMRKGKKVVNLTSLMSQLYTFQLISSNLIYDYIKLFAKDLSEETAELLLKCVRNVGPQLRQDDPLALKEIVLLVQNAVLRIGEKELSVRTKFMIETINNLKNNRMKTGIAASELTSEHTIRMKKALGSLNTRKIKATEPLRIGLSDIRESDKRGKWWLIGASYRDPAEEAQQGDASLGDRIRQDKDESIMARDASTDLRRIAREQRMNTDVRRSIFVAIMSATDYNDAFQRLMKLRLKRSQEHEVPKVIIHCAGAEEAYNPYYTLVARRVCSERKSKMAFQFSLWDLFKQMGEGVDDGLHGTDEDDAKLGMRSIVNLARMFGTLIAEGGLSLTVLKILNFPYLQPKTRTFVEILMITIMLRSQKGPSDSRDEKSITDIFVQEGDKPELAKGLQYFLRKTVAKTDVAGTKADKETVKWGCRVARDALDVAVSLPTVES